MPLQADDRVRQMVWPSLHADFTLVETYKVFDSAKCYVQYNQPVCLLNPQY